MIRNMFQTKFKNSVKRAALLLLLTAAFFVGRFAARVQEGATKDAGKNSAGVTTGGTGQSGTGTTAVGAEQGGTGMTTVGIDQSSAAMTGVGAEKSSVSAVDGTVEENIAGTAVAESANQVSVHAAAEGSWGLSFQEEGKPPVANATREELAQFNAWYSADTEEKILYLTFDCGYENGNTPAILEALQKHNVPATFFVVGNFVADNPDLVKQIIEQGHTVGNHTMHHPDMSQLSDLASFQAELQNLETLFKEATGQEMTKFYRPPQGKYSESNLKMAQELGYQTFFWSLAYVDWYENDQPTKEEAFEKLLGRIHPGAIVLLHNTSATNGAILDELLTKWEEMGYRFGSLKELVGAESV